MATRYQVLIVSTADDVHANIVARSIEQGNLGHPILLDFHDFPAQSSLTFQNGGRWCLRLPSDELVTSDEVAGVWLRRPQEFSFGKAILDPAIEAFCEVNCRHAVQGLLETLGNRVVDPIFRVEAASRKVFQLHVAETSGLPIPRTCVTNDPDTARAFIEGTQRSVYKIFRGSGPHYAGTTMIETADLANLHLVRECPVIFQEFIPPGFDIRVTIVGDKIFSAKLTSEKPHAQVDIRLDLACDIEPYSLPGGIESGTHELMSRLGLRFAAIDMRVDELGRHYFLEVNPVGQYLFVEVATNYPITAALAQLLADPLRSSSYIDTGSRAVQEPG